MINSVLIGTNPDGFDVYRRRNRWSVDEINPVIRVEYEEFLLISGKELNKVSGLCYFVRDVFIGEDPNGTGTPLALNFFGFSDWDNYDIGGLPAGVRLGKDVISPKIDATLSALPIGVKNGHTLTEAV